MDWNEFLDLVFYHNTVTAWGIAVAVLVITLGGLALVRRTAVGQLRSLGSRTGAGFTAVLSEAVASTRFWFLLLLSIRASSLALRLPTRFIAILREVVVLGVLFQIAVWGNAALRRWLERYSEQNLAADASSVTTMRAVVFAGRVLLWVIVVLVGLDNHGIKVSALVTGLGIGGIAIALAAQNILGDLFSSLSIVVDKPFVVGDAIRIDDMTGTVDRIGLKTTRIRSLGGEQLVFSNSDLLKSRIRNYRPMIERRVDFKLGVDYKTPLETLKKIPTIIREAIEAQEQTRFDRAHFTAFGDSALAFEVVYFMLVPDYTVYMDTQQNINFHVVGRFEAEGIAFAHPTRTLYFNHQTAPPALERGQRPGDEVAD